MCHTPRQFPDRSQSAAPTRGGAAGSSSAAGRRGFTLIEVTVVIVILALLATMTVPRLLGNQKRVFRATCDQVADLLTMYARRESLGGKPIALTYDERRRWLIVNVYDIDPEDGTGLPAWRWDSFIQPVKLPESAHVAEVRVDGSAVDIARWPVTSRPGHERPTIEIVMEGPDEFITVVLTPHAVTPRQFRDGEQVNYPGPIDLNAIGRTREDW